MKIVPYRGSALLVGWIVAAGLWGGSRLEAQAPGRLPTGRVALKRPSQTAPAPVEPGEKPLPPAADSKPTSAANPTPEPGAFSGLRDPFRAPAPPQPGEIGGKAGEPAAPRRPGLGGLLVRELRLEGTVREENTQTMIAVVTNETHLAYFLRENQELSDGVVGRITPGAVYLRERIREPNQAVKWREVVLKLESDSGGRR
jgi:hypothetical protein